MSRKAAKKDALLERARSLPRAITREDCAAWRAEFALSDSYLHKILRESGLPLSPLVEGVRQDSLDHLERTLLALLDQYRPADTSLRRVIRALLISAKDHARLALRSPHANHALRQEAILWLTLWLEDPESFPSWVALRKRKLGLPA